MTTAARIASRYLYARLFLAMSLQEAKEALGFPPHANPSPLEINKAWRAKAFENHPDRGGNNEKMVEINVAKDILEGKGRATLSPRNPTPTPTYTPRSRPEPPKVVETIEGDSFEKAISGVHARVEWKFVSKPTWASSLNGYSATNIVWTAVGVLDKLYVVVSVKHCPEWNEISTEKGGVIKHTEYWQANVELSRNRSALISIPKMIKHVCETFADGSKAKPPKKWALWAGGKLTEHAINAVKWGGGGLPLKDVLLATGFVDSTEKAVAGRKTVVEMSFKSNPEKRERLRKQGYQSYTWVVLDIIVRVNGKEYVLSDATSEKLAKNFFGWTIPWEAVSDGNTRNLTKLREGRFKGGAEYALMKLIEDLTSEPAELKASLEKALEENRKPEEKTAANVAERFAR
jgi:hypothetical protein